MNIGTRERVIVALLVAICLCAQAEAQAPAPAEREVTFHNGTVELHGTLMLPTEPGPHPAVVFLHGSGPSTRAGARPYAEAFAKLGLASLFFDKRGCGSSGGSWLTCSLEDLANDALAAVKCAAEQDDVDPERIGLWGVSQAGWVATLAASTSQDIAFMIVISGGGATPRESELFSYGRVFERARLSEAERSEASEALEAYFQYLETGDGRDELVSRLEAAHGSAWYPHVRLDRILPSEENRVNWRWVASWDPAPHIANITCPVLLMFGDSDVNHPTETAIRKWREGLAEAHNDDVTLMVFPGAGHGIRLADSQPEHGRAPFADGYREIMLGWLWLHVVQGEK